MAYPGYETRARARAAHATPRRGWARLLVVIASLAAWAGIIATVVAIF